MNGECTSDEMLRWLLECFQNDIGIKWKSTLLNFIRLEYLWIVKKWLALMFVSSIVNNGVEFDIVVESVANQISIYCQKIS